MSGRFVPRLFGALLVLAGIIGLGIFAYQLGVAQGAAQGLPAGAEGVPGPYYGYPHHFGPFWGGFGCFGALIPLFLLFVFFGALRMMFGRGHWGHHGGWRKWSEGGVPPMFEEWHQRAHEPKADAPDEPKPEGKAAKA